MFQVSGSVVSRERRNPEGYSKSLGAAYTGLERCGVWCRSDFLIRVMPIRIRAEHLPLLVVTLCCYQIFLGQLNERGWRWQDIWRAWEQQKCLMCFGGET